MTRLMRGIIGILGPGESGRGEAATPIMAMGLTVTLGTVPSASPARHQHNPLTFR